MAEGGDHPTPRGRRANDRAQFKPRRRDHLVCQRGLLRHLPGRVGLCAPSLYRGQHPHGERQARRDLPAPGRGLRGPLLPGKHRGGLLHRPRDPRHLYRSFRGETAGHHGREHLWHLERRSLSALDGRGHPDRGDVLPAGEQPAGGQNRQGAGKVHPCSGL